MTPLSRAFLAVYPPADVLDTVEERVRALGRSDALRWIPRDQWHVTLRFVGPVAEPGALVAALGPSLAELAPVEGLRLTGAGAFPRARHGSVLWVGLADDEAAAALAGVAATVARACVDAGLPPDDRDFRAHLTIGRRTRAGDLRPLVAGFGATAVGPPWSVREVRLMESETRSTGSLHTEVARFPLSG